MYLFASAAFAMKVTALHLWSIFTPKSGANAKEREGRMYFDVAQRFAALIAGVRQTSLKLSAKASAGCQGVCRFVTSDCMTKCRDYEFRVLDPSALFAKKSQKNC